MRKKLGKGHINGKMGIFSKVIFYKENQTEPANIFGKTVNAVLMEGGKTTNQMASFNSLMKKRKNSILPLAMGRYFLKTRFLPSDIKPILE